jgi:hypothetical protein
MDSAWRTGSEWYRNIETALIAEHSAEMLQALPKWGTTGIFQVDFSFVVMDGAGASPVMFPNYEEGDNVPIPMPAKGYIEGEFAYNANMNDACPEGDDCHAIVIDRASKRLYEVYQAKKSGSMWTGYPNMWKLDKNYPRQNRGKGCTSADAAGLAITPGLIGYKETKAGTIAHALRLVVRNEYIRGSGRDARMVAYPASHGSTATKSPTGIPYGARLRLKASVSDADPRFTSPGAKSIVKALKKYGMILTDGGNIPLMAESDRLYKDADPKSTWEGTLGARDLNGILPADFEVVGIPKDVPGGATPGYFSSRTEYEAQLQTPLGCDAIVQP